MSGDLEDLLRRVRETALLQGPGWIEQQLLGAPPAASAPGGDGGTRPRARRSRPPERLSPDIAPCPRRRRRSPTRDPSASSGRRSGRAAAGVAGRNPRQRPGAVEPGVQQEEAPTPGRQESSSGDAASLSTEVPSAGQAQRGDRRRSSHDSPLARSSEARGRRPSTLRPGEDVAVSDGGVLDSPAPSASSGEEDPVDDRGEVPAAAASFIPDHPRERPRPRSAVSRTTASSAAPAASAARGPSSSAPGGPAAAPRRRSRGETAAGPSAPVRSGECTTISTNTGFGGDTNAGLEGMQWFLRGMQDLFAGRAANIAGSPLAVWDGSGSVSAVRPVAGGVAAVTPSAVSAGGGQEKEGQVAGGAAVTVEKDKAAEEVRMADSAKGEVYVCFEGPLGAHLKAEVRERIWKGEYVEIFSLLPLEKFNLDRVKPDESKKEEEERRRYRLIPRTFNNWLQAFAILASVVGEKAPEHCSALFCYLDAVGEAYRVYGGTAWLRYDEHFRQRKAVRPSIRWDHKDISLWMRLMAAPRGGPQPFREAAGGSGSAAGRSVTSGRGCCWQFNEGSCKFGADCRFKHECSGCGGAHGLTRCFKKGRGKSGEAEQKRGDAGEGGKDAPVSRFVPK